MKQAHTQLILQFKHRIVRDLAWVLLSPPLVAGEIDNVHWWSFDDCLREFNDCREILLALDENPEPLIAHLHTIKNRRLGSVFEGFVSYWLNISPNYKLLHHNIQIIHNNHTYGEVDFIIEALATGKIIHLEVAVKFYLGCPPYEDAYRWFGTNTKDQLGKKIDHLKKHQTQLSTKHPNELSRYVDQTIDERHCIIKGRLFYSTHSNSSPTNLPLAENHLRGRWLYVNDREYTDKVIMIKKSHWLCEFNADDIGRAEFSNDSDIQAIDRAECFVKVNMQSNQYSENQRIFYLPQDFTFPD